MTKSTDASRRLNRLQRDCNRALRDVRWLQHFLLMAVSGEPTSTEAAVVMATEVSRLGEAIRVGLGEYLRAAADQVNWAAERPCR